MELIDMRFHQLCAKYTSGGAPAPGDDVPVDFDLIDEWAWRCGVSVSRLLDEFAVRLARMFDRGDLSFEYCDSVINDLYGASLNSRLSDFPRLFWKVYEAFDAGEYHRASDKSDDPVSEHTIPLIKELLVAIDF